MEATWSPGLGGSAVSQRVDKQGSPRWHSCCLRWPGVLGVEAYTTVHPANRHIYIYVYACAIAIRSFHVHVIRVRAPPGRCGLEALIRAPPPGRIGPSLRSPSPAAACRPAIGGAEWRR